MAGMAPDRDAVEKRRFARLLGLDADHGMGLPVGPQPGDSTDSSIDRSR